MFVLDKYPINPSERFLKPLKTSLKRKTPIGETSIKTPMRVIPNLKHDNSIKG